MDGKVVCIQIKGQGRSLDICIGLGFKELISVLVRKLKFGDY